MKNNFIFSLLAVFAIGFAALTFSACSGDDDDNNGGKETVATPETSTDSSKILVAYFSCGGNTRAVASRIAQLTGGTLYEIQPATPYTTDYNELAYTVARNELDTDARPALKEIDADFSKYDYVFLGCPVCGRRLP